MEHSFQLQEKQGLRISEFRKFKNITQSEFAAKINCSQPNLVKMEKGQVGVSSRMRQKLFTAFPELNPQWLDNGMGSMLIDRSSIDELKEGDGTSNSVLKSLPKFEKLMEEGKVPFEVVISVFKDMRKIIQIQESRIKDLEEDKSFLKTIITSAKDSRFKE